MFRRHQEGAVLEAPAVVLHAGHLQPPGSQFDGEIDDLADPRGVVAVNDRVDGEGHARLDDPARDLQFAAVGVLQAADPIAARGIGVLEAELDVFQSGRRQPAQPVAVQQNTRCNQVGVQIVLGGVADQRLEILAGRRFAAGEMHLIDTERRGLVEHPRPRRGIELAAGRLQVHRIGTVQASHGAAMGEFGKQRERRVDTHSARIPLSARS